jgi:hypothetical protein
LAKQIVDAQDETSDAAKTFRALGIDMRSLAADQKTTEALSREWLMGCRS